MSQMDIIHCNSISIKKWSQHLNKGDWLDQPWHMHALDCHAAVNKNEGPA